MLRNVSVEVANLGSYKKLMEAAATINCNICTFVYTESTGKKVVSVSTHDGDDFELRFETALSVSGFLEKK